MSPLLFATLKSFILYFHPFSFSKNTNDMFGNLFCILENLACLLSIPVIKFLSFISMLGHGQLHDFDNSPLHVSDNGPILANGISNCIKI